MFCTASSGHKETCPCIFICEFDMLYTLSFGHLKVAGGAKVLVLNFLGKRMVVLVQKGSSIQNVFYKQNGRPEHQKTNLLKQQDNLTIKLGDFTVRVKSKPAFYFPNRMAVKEENNKMFYCATQRGFPDQPPSEWSLKDVPPPQLVIPTGRPVKLEVTAPGRKLPEVLQVEWMSHCASFLTLGPEEARSELEVGAKASHRPRSREFKTPRGEKPIDGHGKRGSKTLRDVWCAEQPQQALLQEETQIAKVMARMQKRSNSSKTAKRKSKPGAPPASLPEEKMFLCDQEKKREILMQARPPSTSCRTPRSSRCSLWKKPSPKLTVVRRHPPLLLWWASLQCPSLCPDPLRRLPPSPFFFFSVSNKHKK